MPVRLVDIHISEADGPNTVGSGGVFIDDVLVYSESWEELLLHLEAVLQRLKEAGLMAKRSKWGKSQLEYLGRQIGKGRLAVPEDRADKLLQSFHARL